MGKPIAITCIPLQSTFVKSRGIVIREEETIMIGRAKDGVESENSLQFSTRVVSRKHAEIIYRNGLHIRDAGSSSGTFLNEQRLSSLMQESDLHELHSGDIIRLGDDCILNGVQYYAIVFRINIAGIERDAEDPFKEAMSEANTGDSSELAVEFKRVWNTLPKEKNETILKLKEMTKDTISAHMKSQQTNSRGKI